MADSEATPQRSRIAAARERADKAKTTMLAAALIAFFVTMGFERADTTTRRAEPARLR